MTPIRRKVDSGSVFTIPMLTAIGTDDLVQVVEGYRSRKYDEEIVAIEKWGGNKY